MPTQNEQKLVNICFDIALLMQDPVYAKFFREAGREGTAEWVAKQLSDCGFNTTPCGASWGLLESSPN